MGTVKHACSVESGQTKIAHFRFSPYHKPLGILQVIYHGVVDFTQKIVQQELGSERLATYRNTWQTHRIVRIDHHRCVRDLANGLVKREILESCEIRRVPRF